MTGGFFMFPVQMLSPQGGFFWSQNGASSDEHKAENLHEEEAQDAEVMDDEDRSGASAQEASNGPSKEILELKEKLAETTDKMLRIAADFENTRKRWERERQEVRTYAVTEFARDLLPVIDAFDNALMAIEQTSNALESAEGQKVTSIVEGVKLVSKVFLDTLKKHGVERIVAKGEAFNPLHHNAVARVVDTSVKQDTVIDEFAAGYKISDRVLRTAMVRVATPD
jgi:molecular chaperone GrpE